MPKITKTRLDPAFAGCWIQASSALSQKCNDDGAVSGASIRGVFHTSSPPFAVLRAGMKKKVLIQPVSPTRLDSLVLAQLRGELPSLQRKLVKQWILEGRVLVDG